MKNFLKKNWFALIVLIAALFIVIWIPISGYFLDEEVYCQQLIYIASYSTPFILVFIACLIILGNSEELSDEKKKEIEMKKNFAEFLKDYNERKKSK